MPVPKFEEFFLPVLKFFDDDEIHTKVEVSKYMVEYFNLNEEELNERTSSGNSLRYKDRTGWAVDYLYRATLLDRVERGKYIISDEGKNVLKMDLENIDNNFLLGYDSFKEFQNVSTTKTEVKYEKEVLSPSDRINEALLEINNNLSSNLLEEIFSRDSDFFEKLRGGALPNTSAISAESYRNYFEPIFAEGSDIMYVHFSAAMSATF